MDAQVEELTSSFQTSMKAVNKEKSRQIKFCKQELHTAELEAE